MTGPRVLDGRDPSAIEYAVGILRAGDVVAMPTETVYGLAGATLDTNAVERIYRLKGRPSDNPLIAHVEDAAAARRVLRPGSWTDSAERLATAFWPGPLTLVLPRSEEVDPVATGGRDSIAVRSPAHPVAQALLSAFGGPLSAPSANRSGAVSPTTSEHVASDHAGTALCILDGGPCTVGLESTVLDLRGSVPRILRPGSIKVADLEPLVGPVEATFADVQGDAPGTSLRHYAPKTPVCLVEDFSDAGPDDAVIRFRHSAPEGVRFDALLGDVAADAARGLYEAMRGCDGSGATRILAEQPPSSSDWQAITDRLRRACARS
ncbi:MAG: threonylcarbamoyl-AMP synthase [Phycisphaerales bacterium]|nr:threonylcarbamoyl-AMP synthase [Phycisphaerales bacterium]